MLIVMFHWLKKSANCNIKVHVKEANKLQKVIVHDQVMQQPHTAFYLSLTTIYHYQFMQGIFCYLDVPC